MDERARRFREAARRENRGRRGTARRYSEELHREAVTYVRARRAQGESLASCARALGLPGPVPGFLGQGFGGMMG